MESKNALIPSFTIVLGQIAIPGALFALTIGIINPALGLAEVVVAGMSMAAALYYLIDQVTRYHRHMMEDYIYDTAGMDMDDALIDLTDTLDDNSKR